MQQLTIKEQKEILGGMFVVYIKGPDPTDEKIYRTGYFGTYDLAEQWGLHQTKYGGRYEIEEI